MLVNETRVVQQGSESSNGGNDPEIEEKIAAKEAQKAQLVKETRKLEQENRKLEQEKTQLVTKAQKLEQEIESNNKEIKRLSQEQKKLEEEKSKKTTERQKAQEKSNVLTRDIQSIIEKITRELKNAHELHEKNIAQELAERKHFLEEIPGEIFDTLF